MGITAISHTDADKNEKPGCR